MIFQEDHIKQILEGKKTQTRRVSLGGYKPGKDYAIQPGRGKFGILGYRIFIEEIQHEWPDHGIPISPEDAEAEGDYHPFDYELHFRKLNPRWNSEEGRWAIKFRLVKEN